MRTAVLPAQVTTVEDRIAANLSLNQLILIVIPLFLTALMYFGFPPFSQLAIYKNVVAVLVAVVFLTLAYRINDKIVLEWLLVKIRYWSRPRVYVYLRSTENQNNKTISQKTDEPSVQAVTDQSMAIEIDPLQLVQAAQVIKKESLSLVFKPNKRGGLNVSVYQT